MSLRKGHAASRWLYEAESRFGDCNKTQMNMSLNKVTLISLSWNSAMEVLCMWPFCLFFRYCFR